MKELVRATVAIFSALLAAAKTSAAAHVDWQIVSNESIIASLGKKCFDDGEELKAAVRQYVAGDCGNSSSRYYAWCNFGYGWPMNSWCVGNVTDMSELFYGGGALRPSTTPLYPGFNEDVGDWDVSRVTDMSYMFHWSPFNRSLDHWDVSRVTNFAYMFGYTPYFQHSGISLWNTSSAVYMTLMFYGSGFNGDLSSWDLRRVKSVEGMFAGSSFNHAGVSKWNTSSITKMTDLFYDSLFDQDLSGWDVSNVNDMRWMFVDSPFNQDLCSWRDAFPYESADTSWMFYGSGCEFQDSPNINGKGPFCASNCSATDLSASNEPTSSPTGCPAWLRCIDPWGNEACQSVCGIVCYGGCFSDCGGCHCLCEPTVEIPTVQPSVAETDSIGATTAPSSTAALSPTANEDENASLAPTSAAVSLAFPPLHFRASVFILSWLGFGV